MRAAAQKKGQFQMRRGEKSYEMKRR